MTINKEVIVVNKKFKLYSGLSGIIYSILLCGIYIYLRNLPFFDVFLDADRRRYFLVIYIFSVIGAFLYIAANEIIAVRKIKLPIVLTSLFLLFGIPLILLITNGLSSKGWEWAISTFLIGLFPTIAISMGFLVLYGYKKFSLGLIILFGISILFYLVMSVVQSGIFGRTLTPTKLVDVLFVIIIIVFSAVSIHFNLENYKIYRIESAAASSPHHGE